MDTGKSDPVSEAWGELSEGHEFEEQQLKQLRAQCIVFLAFKNGLNPKKHHLEIALANISSKLDGTHRDVIVEVPSSLERPDSSTGHPSRDSDSAEFPDERIEDGNDTKRLAMLRL